MYSTSESDSELCLTLAITVKKSSRAPRPISASRMWALGERHIDGVVYFNRKEAEPQGPAPGSHPANPPGGIGPGCQVEGK